MNHDHYKIAICRYLLTQLTGIVRGDSVSRYCEEGLSRCWEPEFQRIRKAVSDWAEMVVESCLQLIQSKKSLLVAHVAE